MMMTIKYVWLKHLLSKGFYLMLLIQIGFLYYFDESSVKSQQKTTFEGVKEWFSDEDLFDDIPFLVNRI